MTYINGCVSLFNMLTEALLAEWFFQLLFGFLVFLIMYALIRRMNRGLAKM